MAEHVYRVEGNVEGTVMVGGSGVCTLLRAGVYVSDGGVLSVVFKTPDSSVCLCLDTDSAQDVARALIAASAVAIRQMNQE